MSTISRSNATMASCWVASQAVIWDSVVMRGVPIGVVALLGFPCYNAVLGKSPPGRNRAKRVESSNRTQSYTKCTVESRRGAVLRKQFVSPPRSSNRTCGFPASGFPTGFVTGSRRGVRIATHPWAQHAKRAVHRVHADLPAAARRQLVAPGEEVAHAVIQVRLDHPVRGV